MIHETIYKRTRTGAVQIWYAETEGDKYRTVSGQQDGKKIVTEWTVCTPKNVGKSNATTGEQQALIEVQALYKKKLEKDYSRTSTEIDNEGYFKPMLCEKWEKDSSVTSPFYIQPKLDGIRCIARADGLWTRNGKRHVNVPHIEEALKAFFKDNPGAVLDGELYNHVLKDDFNEICSLVKKTKPTPESIEQSKKFVQYHVYDIHDGSDSLYGVRRAKLGILLQGVKSEYIVAVPTTIILCVTPDDNVNDIVTQYHDEYVEDGYEGAIVRLNSAYVNGRTKNILKVKEFITEEFRLEAIDEGKGNWAGFAKTGTFSTKDGKQFKASIKGTKAFCKEVYNNKNKYINTLCTVKYLNLTPDGIPRHGNIIEFDRKDV